MQALVVGSYPDLQDKGDAGREKTKREGAYRGEGGFRLEKHESESLDYAGPAER
jgi:hypothetical protein